VKDIEVDHKTEFVMKLLVEEASKRLMDDWSLSLDAKVLFALMLECGFKVKMSELLTTKGRLGRFAVMSVLQELLDEEYIVQKHYGCHLSWALHPSLAKSLVIGAYNSLDS
jgi:hypothetical protein